MNLENYLRSELSSSWRPLVIKHECEVCGKDNNLEVHHVKQFILLLDETLQLLKLNRKRDTDDYSVDELEKIKLIMLGKHLKIKTLTLCNKCHDILHKTNGVIILNNISDIKKHIKTKLNIEKLEEYLESLITKKIFKEEQILIRLNILKECTIISNRKLRGKTGKISHINSILSDIGVNYRLISNKDGSKKSETYGLRYWTIGKQCSNLI